MVGLVILNDLQMLCPFVFTYFVFNLWNNQWAPKSQRHDASRNSLNTSYKQKKQINLPNFKFFAPFCVCPGFQKLGILSPVLG